MHNLLLFFAPSPERKKRRKKTTNLIADKNKFGRSPKSPLNALIHTQKLSPIMEISRVRSLAWIFSNVSLW
jgi:hypothetical protein